MLLNLQIGYFICGRKMIRTKMKLEQDMNCAEDFGHMLLKASSVVEQNSIRSSAFPISSINVVSARSISETNVDE